MKGIPGSPRKSHGMTGTKKYDCWLQMRHRCNNSNDPRYADYGGRGVLVHPDWDRPFGGFEAFFAYMGKCPPDKNSIDRWPNPNGNYEPGNVRWGNAFDQNNNKRTNRLLTFEGRTMTISQWGRERGLSKVTIRRRLCMGWPVELAIKQGNFQGKGGRKRALTSTPTLIEVPTDEAVVEIPPPVSPPVE